MIARQASATIQQTSGDPISIARGPAVHSLR